MNQKEWRKLKEARDTLARGPGDGWPTKPSTVQEVMDHSGPRTRLWLETWVLPAIDALLERYRPKAKRR